MPLRHLHVLRSGDRHEQLRLDERDPLPAWPRDAGLNAVGRGLARLEAVDKVTGRARYAADVRPPGLLYAALLRCPHPHAKLVHIDTGAARGLDGVRAVLSSVDGPQLDWYDDSRLFATTLRFAGEEIAAVAADTPEIAAEALRLIEVDYDPLPFVADLDAALRPDAPRVYPDGNRAGEAKTERRGDFDAAFAAAEFTVDAVYTTQTAVHNSLEPHGCTASWDGDRLTLWESTQGVFEVREQVAAKLGLGEHQVRVICEHMGGGFGAKQIVWKQTVIAALLARASGRPVQLMLDRAGENLAVGNRNATRQRVRLGARRDGTLTAIGLDAAVAVGAYALGGESSMVAGPCQRMYRCDNVATRQQGVYLNAGPSVAFRAPGYVEGTFALESAMDELARRLAMDPLTLRRKNYAERDQRGDKPFTSPDALRRCYEAAAEAFDAQRTPPSGNGRKRRGVGVAAHDWIAGAGHPPAYAWVKLNGDGGAEVITATQDIGTGSRTALAQVAAEELGLAPERVALHLGDTARGPYAPTSAGSATLASLGPAVREACADARRQLLIAAAALLGENDPQQLSVVDGRVRTRRDAGDAGGIDVAELTSRIAPQMIQGHGARGPNPDDSTVRNCGVQIAEVEVDLDSGELCVLRLVGAHDCGRIVNPRLVDSQVYGGMVQGLGFALSEQRLIDPQRGVVLNADLENYLLPTVADLPAQHHARIDLPDPAANSVGAKGVGESPIIPTAAAIANAVYDATGIRFHDLPLTRQRLLAALCERRDAADRAGRRDSGTENADAAV